MYVSLYAYICMSMHTLHKHRGHKKASDITLYIYSGARSLLKHRT